MGERLVISVDSSKLQEMFKDGDYWARAKKGEFRFEMLKDDHPSFKRSNIPRCTRSQMIGYFDENGVRIVLMHQYRLQNGLLGASGKPDPKELLLDGVIYSAD
jgi:hypothetical protein